MANAGAAAVHDGVMCEATGQCPIVGNRWYLPFANYNLCEEAHMKLPPENKVFYWLIETPQDAKRVMDEADAAADAAASVGEVARAP